ncbi:MAG: chromosomal replication initiator protein DnaA, chromosomal replication initiator protein [candidate division WWE3 bacterium GW2011_GWC1_47_10]|uniref:Chromosomal replication initiator protein DnaA n=1 Tax=candidate division WWE3 bacterium GW2011_GWC1_47_10 TaxID=1619122 RepID=A0A0G1QYJ1_UNCKA|nr:MAG: chromosomal replication initiator protein DnaA, chromosomal replication initiator protein [candidate division WWE3 bacterium GW2011_GWC1_47_10]
MDTKTLWETVLADLETQLSPLFFNTWLKPTRLKAVDDDTLQIICRDANVRNTIQKKLLPLIDDAFVRAKKRKYTIEFDLGESEKKSQQNELIGPLFETIKQSPKNGGGFGLSPKYTFENYLVGAHNQLAYAVANAIAQTPGKDHNPFFLYSGVGQGKTHLIQAIGNALTKNKPELKIIYITGESFTNELIEAIQTGKGGGKYTTNKFRDKYRKADVLLIDDVQFIAGRDSTQEEFFHTFNALHMAGKQIVITSDRPPQDFTNLEDRIKSRFKSGMIADIQPPSVDMRVAILRTKRDENHDDVTNEAIDLIAMSIDSNVRELMGAYLQILTGAKTDGLKVTEELVRKSLGSVIKDVREKAVNLNQILKAVCNYYTVKAADLKGKRRTKELVIPRQMAMFLIWDMTKTPYMSIGEFLGGRDHTTIMYGVRKVEEGGKASVKVKQDVANIKQNIYTTG